MGDCKHGPQFLCPTVATACMDPWKRPTLLSRFLGANISPHQRVWEIEISLAASPGKEGGIRIHFLGKPLDKEEKGEAWQNSLFGGGGRRRGKKKKDYYSSIAACDVPGGGGPRMRRDSKRILQVRLD